MRAPFAHEGDAPLQPLRDHAGSGKPAFEVAADQPGDRPPHRQQPFGIGEHFGIAAVPGNDLQFGVHHADALTHVLQRRAQHALVEAQVVGRLVNDRRHRCQPSAAVAAGRLDQQPCRCGADHCSQLVLDGGQRRRRHFSGVIGIPQQFEHAFARQEPRRQRAQLRDRQRLSARAIPAPAPARALRHDDRRQIGQQTERDGARQRAPVEQTEQALRRQRAERGEIQAGQLRQQQIAP